MVQFKHNEVHYRLRFDGLPDDTVQVLAFEGEEAISSFFEYRIELLSEDAEIDAAKILNNKATLIISRGDEDPVNIYGVICYFEQCGRAAGYIHYRAVLVPRLWLLNLARQNAVYQNLKIDKLLTEVMKENGFTSRDFECQLTAAYPDAEYTVQFQESNLNFLQRRLEHFGVFYYFDHRDQDVAVFVDSNDRLKKLKPSDVVCYNQNRDALFQNDSITAISCRHSVVTGVYQLKDYNCLFPNKQLLTEYKVNKTTDAVQYEFGENVADENQADFIAKVRGQEIAASGILYQGKSDCRLFHAGFRFSLEKHYRSDWNSEYIITGLKVQGNQRNLFTDLPSGKNAAPIYSNVFEAVPFDLPFRPKCKTPIPRLPGIMSARIESTGQDQYAYLDDQGRYHLKSVFDLKSTRAGESSLPVRLAQPYSGAGYGMHFPNLADNEMIWACLDGDLDRPVGLGTVPNAIQASPTVAKNKTQNIIRTASGNEILLEDKIQETQIRLTTPDAHTFILDDKDDKIELTTTGKHVLTMDDKNKNITVQTTSGHILIMDDDDKKPKIMIQSKNGHRISINDEANKENIMVTDKNEENLILIDITNNKLVIQSANGDMDLLAENGTITVKATTLNVETSGDTSLKAANIKAEAQQDYSLKASNIKEEAQMDYKEKGMNIKSEAAMEHKSKGMNVTSEAGVNQQVKGTMVTVQGSATTTIKGGVVMIN